MAGKTTDRGGGRKPARVLHIRGRLGFHAPYLTAKQLAPRSYNRTELVASYQAAVKSINEAIRIFDYGIRTSSFEYQKQPWVRGSLFIEMLSRSSTALFLIDTVGKAVRWDIDLAGTKTNNGNKLTRVEVGNVCKNYFLRKNDLDSFSKKGDEEFDLQIVGKGKVMISNDMGAVMYCYVQNYKYPGFSELEMTIRNFTDEGIIHMGSIPYWQIHDADLPLSELVSK